MVQTKETIMPITKSILTLLAGALGLTATGCEKVQLVENDAPTSVLSYEIERIDGSKEMMNDHQGSVLLVVNVASRCGFTSQYEGLQAIYDAKSDDGLIVMGFPSNQFMGQEPGSNEQIAEFCSTTYGVEFPMYAKTKVKGDDAHPMFKAMNEAVGEPSWNFNKYLVDRSGNIVARYGSNVTPDDEELVAHIDRLLAES